jgi:hypothetical protein
MTPVGGSEPPAPHPAGRPTEDEWWRQLYGDPPPDPPHAAPAAPAADPPHAGPPPDPPHAAPAADPAAGRSAADDAVAPPDLDRPPPQARPPDPWRGYAAGPPTPAAAAQVPSLPPGWAPAPAPRVSFDKPAGAPGDTAFDAWPVADPRAPAWSVPDVVLDGAHHGPLTVRAFAARGAGARARGRPRGVESLTARFGNGHSGLLLLVLAGGGQAVARGACEALAARLGRDAVALTADLRGGARGQVRAGLRRLVERVYARMPAPGAGPGGAGEAFLHCALLPADPACQERVYAGAGPGGVFLLRDRQWRDLTGRPAGDAGGWFAPIPARPGDVTLLCGAGSAAPMREVPGFPAYLTQRWTQAGAVPGLPAFLADATVPAVGHLADRCAVGVWEEPRRG